MSKKPDFRSDKSETLEGYGIAAARWKAFHADVPDDVYYDIYKAREAAGYPVDHTWGDDDEDRWEDVSNEVKGELEQRVIEDSELLGFYLAWHLAGGFHKLQDGGWHRATIHRKLRRFRARYGTHPDEFRLPWLKLDLPKAWHQRLVDEMNPEPYDAAEPQDEDW